VLGTFAVALSLSPLAVGTAAVPVYLMMSILILSGAAVLLRVPMLSLPEISVSAQDVERLTRLLDTLSEGQRAAVRGLEVELSRAHVLAPARIPDNVVTMNSRVVYEDVESGAAREAVLVYPDEADAGCDRISVLAPLGSALLGLRVGQAIDWPLGRGQHRRIRVLSLLYQPEAAGDFHL
jgi:regulator of nucleoside diphosphate kinase